MSTVRMLSVLVLLVSVLMALTGAADPESGKNQTVGHTVPRLYKRFTAHWYHDNHGSNPGRCYSYISTPMTWASAERYCESLGGTLASVSSLEEYRTIQNVIFAQTNAHPHAWVGGSDAQQEGVWLWSNGTPFSFTYWCHGEPNNAGSEPQNCLRVNDKAVLRCWDDFQCNTLAPSVCMTYRC